MNIKNAALTFFLLALPGLAHSGDFDDLNGQLRTAIAEKSADRSGAGLNAAIKAAPVEQKSTHAAPAKDDLKPEVISHLDQMIAYCGKNMDDCNGRDRWLRDFAKGIGGGRCNNRGFNCVNEVLEMCKQQAEDGNVTPMYFMACGAMLGKLGERDCAEGRATCAGQLQGAAYFSLRAAAGCHKSFEKDKPRQAEADKLIEAFAREVKQDIKGVYVGHVHGASTVGHQLTWHGIEEGAVMGTEKVLEFALERLAWHGAGAAVGAVSLPLTVFSGAMLFHEIAASEMNNLVCLKWGHYYNGSYYNLTGSLRKMTDNIK